jgi:hypothetical protein
VGLRDDIAGGRDHVLFVVVLFHIV